MSMTIYDLVRKYAKGKGENVMWESTKLLSDTLAPMAESHPDKYWKLIKDMYALMNGPHFDEDFGQWQIEHMYFVDKNGHKHNAPYWNPEQMKSVFDTYKGKIKAPGTTPWDFFVALNMIKSDNWCLFKQWWPDADDSTLDAKVIESTINYFDDEDAPHKEGKIWYYFNK